MSAFDFGVLVATGAMMLVIGLMCLIGILWMWDKSTAIIDRYGWFKTIKGFATGVFWIVVVLFCCALVVAILAGIGWVAVRLGVPPVK